MTFAIFFIFGPRPDPPLSTFGTDKQLTVNNARNLPYYVRFFATLLPPSQCGHHLSMTPYHLEGSALALSFCQGCSRNSTDIELRNVVLHSREPLVYVGGSHLVTGVRASKGRLRVFLRALGA